MSATANASTGVTPARSSRHVTVIRDDYGVPHITAASDRAGFHAVGYTQAEDHFPTLLTHFMMTTGTAAAVHGPAWLASDTAVRRWRHLDEARKQFDRLPDHARGNLRAFIAGVAAYARDHPDEVPPWMPDLEPALPIAVLRTFLWHFMITDAVDVAVTAGVLDDAIAAEFLGPVTAPARASNEWVIAPQRMAEAATVVVSDPHGPIGEFPMFEFELSTPNCHVVGVTAVGCAYPILGHTDNLAWAQTTGAPRVSDCYVIDTQPDGDRLRYRHDGQWRPVHRETVSIDVAGDHVARRELCWIDLNGLPSPVIGRSGDSLYVACTPYAAGAPALEASLHGFLHARTIEQFYQSLAGLGFYPQNTMVGDRHGDTLYVRYGRVPRRHSPDQHASPIPGDTSATAWQGLHPLKDLICLRNPGAGYMHNNNVAPDTMVPAPIPSALSHAAYLPYLVNDSHGRTNDRGRRAHELLGGNKCLTVDDVLTAALDDRWPSAPQWIAALADSVHRNVDLAGDDLDDFRKLLLGFDGHCRADSTAALAYWYWRTALPSTAPDLSIASALVDRVEQGEPLEDAEQELLLAACRHGHARMLTDTGSASTRFGEVFRIGRGGQSWPAHGAAFLRALPVGSTQARPDDVSAVLRVMGYGPPDANGVRWAVSGGRSLRVVAFTEPIRSYSVVLYGQSSRPESPHYADQCALYSARTVRSTYFGQTVPPEHVERRYQLTVTADSALKSAG